MTEENKQIKILDLDEFVPEEKEIVISGTTYRVKGDASVKTMLELMKSTEVWQKNPSKAEAINGLIDSISAFFITPIEKDVLLNLDIAGQLPRLVAFLYGKEIKKDEKPGN